jgi:hypothetical protein
VPGWERVRALDEETALPTVRAVFGELRPLGETGPLPIDATGEIVFDLYCNAVLVIAASDADSAESTSRDVETVVLALLRELKS